MSFDPNSIQVGDNPSDLAYDVRAALTDLDASGGTFTATGTGAVARTATAKIGDDLHVKDFGATGNGTTDDTAAIQAAINAAAGKALYFDALNYKVTAKLTIAAACQIYGRGAVLKPTMADDVLYIPTTAPGTLIDGINIDGGGGSVCGINSVADRVTLNRCTGYNMSVAAADSPRRGAFCIGSGAASAVLNCRAWDIYQTGGQTSRGRAVSIDTGATYCVVRNLDARNVALGVVVAGKWSQVNEFHIETNADNCFYILTTSENTRISDGWLRSVDEPLVVEGKNITFENCTFFDPVGQHMIHVENVDGLNVLGCRQIFTSTTARDASATGFFFARSLNTLSKNIRIEDCYVEIGPGLWGTGTAFWTRTGTVEDWAIKNCHLRFYVPTAGSATTAWFAFNENSASTARYELSNTLFEVYSLDPAATTYTLEVQLCSFVATATISNVHFFGRKVGSSTPGMRLRAHDLSTVNFEGQGTVHPTSGYLQFGNRMPRTTHGSVAPVSGTWVVGDVVMNSAPGTGKPAGWSCTATGTPGTWTAWANL